MVLKVSDNMVGQKALAIGDMTNGTPSLVMIICNHCPYVLFRMQAISQLVKDYNDRVYCIAVNSNDSSKYEEMHQSLCQSLKTSMGLRVIIYLMKTKA